MEKRVKKIVSSGFVFYLIISLLGCSLAWEPFSTPPITHAEMVPLVARVIDEQLETVLPVLEEEGEWTTLARSLDEELSGEMVVDALLKEEGGEAYLNFCYSVATGSDSEELLMEAQGLMGAEEYAQLNEQFANTRSLILDRGTSMSRALPPNQRAEFMRDLQKLLTKTLVLMVAGIVYACIPNVIFWGKITAAAAISVAAGIVATSVMSIYRFYKYDDESLSSSFQDWLVDVTTDPAASFAVATSMITVGKTMSSSPVVTGLIIIVFSIYQVMDLVKPLLKKYNFNA